MKPGEGLQRLVFALESVITNNPMVRLESPKRLRDRDTGRLREHDVVLTFSVNHHELIVAMECRDRSREVGVPDVQAFKKKCERTGVHRGVIVSGSGFAKSALAKAEAMDIGCMALEDAERFNWCQAPGVVHNERDLLPGPPWHFVTSRPFEGEQTLYDGNDKVVDVAAFSNIAQGCLAQRHPAVAAAEDARAVREPVLCSFMNEGASSFYMIDRQGERVPLAQMVINVLYRVRQSVIPFSFHQYVDFAKGERLSEVAVATIEKGKLTGKIVMLSEGAGVRVSFVPEQATGRSDKPPTK